MTHCVHCGALASPGQSHCTSCGQALSASPAPAATTTASATATPRPPGTPDRTMAILALVLNAVLLPGLGSIIGGERKVGWTQIALTAVGLVLVFTLIGAIIGFPLMIGAWIWGIVTGVKILNRAPAPTPAA